MASKQSEGYSSNRVSSNTTGKLPKAIEFIININLFDSERHMTTAQMGKKKKSGPWLSISNRRLANRILESLGSAPDFLCDLVSLYQRSSECNLGKKTKNALLIDFI